MWKFRGVLDKTLPRLHFSAICPSLIDVDELQNHGINAADITKLKLAGVCTIKVRSSPYFIFVELTPFLEQSVPNQERLVFSV
jgi:hypothetical protein